MANETSTWSRLRWPWKALLIAIPIVAIVWFLSSRGFFENTEDRNTTTTNTQHTIDVVTNDSKEKNNKTTTSSGERRIFAYTPEKPVNGTLKGVVEVGATGFNSFVVNIDAQKRWEIVSKEFGNSLVYEGLATTDDIRTGLKKYLAGMFDKGVASRNMHFVISSGAQKEPKTASIVSELKKMGFVVNLVTPEQEGKLALKCVQPPAYKTNSFVADIGSGNTKISWYQGDVLRSLELDGAKYFEKNKSDADVYSSVKSAMGSIPKSATEVCFIIGGIPFEMADKTKVAGERYTVLNAPSSYTSDKAKFKSGVNIYKAIEDGTGCDTFEFVWDANFTIGFLLGLP